MELNNGSLISTDICETVETFNHTALVLVAEAGLWSRIPLIALGRVLVPDVAALTMVTDVTALTTDRDELRNLRKGCASWANAFPCI